MLSRADQDKATENSSAETEHICVNHCPAFTLNANLFGGRTL